YDNGLIVSDQPANPLDVLINTSPGSLDGVVVSADQKPFMNALVALVPAENRRQNLALYRTSRSNEQGRLTLTNVPPGLYNVYAWEDMSPGAYQNTEILSRYNGRGTPVNIQAGIKFTATVNVIR